MVTAKKRTIIVVFTDYFLHTANEINRKKFYTFNTKSEVKSGELIESPMYDTPMQVVSVLDDAFRYYNNSNGDLSDTVTSTSQRKIRDLVIMDRVADDVVIAYRKGTLETVPDVLGDVDYNPMLERQEPETVDNSTSYE